MINIQSILYGIFNKENYTLRNFTTFMLVLLPIQYGLILGTGFINPIKVVFMAIAGLVLLTHFIPNKAFFLCSLYLAWLYFVAGGLFPATYRGSTLIYTTLFVLTFLCVYTAVWNYEVFTIEYFIKFLRYFILFTVVFLICQQIFLLLGIRIFPLLNMYFFINRGIGSNSLFFEPSHFARVLCVLYYAFLKCNEYKEDHKITIFEIFSEKYRWVTIAFIWAVLTMGSGTAFVGAGIISLYFMRGWGFLVAIPIFIIVFFILERSGNESFERVQNASMATMTGDADMVSQADHSASYRIIPMLNTIKADFTKSEMWIGEGTDSLKNKSGINKLSYMGHINDYGLISYIIELAIIFTCAIRFRSLGTIFFITGTGGGIFNIAYSWGLLMIFSCVTYFYYQYHNYKSFNLSRVVE